MAICAVLYIKTLKISKTFNSKGRKSRTCSIIYEFLKSKRTLPLSKKIHIVLENSRTKIVIYRIVF